LADLRHPDEIFSERKLLSSHDKGRLERKSGEFKNSIYRGWTVKKNLPPAAAARVPTLPQVDPPASILKVNVFINVPFKEKGAWKVFLFLTCLIL
jgi:hypothetical protein